ncbi:MAG: hypothetical protein JSS70_15945 [Bacteroidetes bacterium]|nr:hypothetical protein [Bacteroidota bacterium]
MRWMKWIGILSALLLVVSCFTPWVFIASKNITVSGVDATGTNFGKPGYFHFIMAGIYILFTLVPKVWTQRSNLLICAFNIGWAVRNFIIIPTCQMGDCPEKKSGLYFTLLASILMLVASLFPDIKIDQTKGSGAK